MFASMYAADGVGLAAPQIGVSLNVFVYDCRDAEDRRHVGHIVNPEVVSTSGPIDNGGEGCLSVPGPFHELARPWLATLRGVNRTGTPIEVTGTGYFARCLLHEAEHLRGILFIDTRRATAAPEGCGKWSPSRGTPQFPPLQDQGRKCSLGGQFRPRSPCRQGAPDGRDDISGRA